MNNLRYLCIAKITIIERLLAAAVIYKEYELNKYGL